MTGYHYILVALAGVAGGGVNALAGGGTLITFPTLMALGLPPVSANVTNTVALCPGYLAGTFAQSGDLQGRRRLWPLAVVSIVGGITGGLLLLMTGERAFGSLVPFLILFAAGLLAFQNSVRAWVARRSGRDKENEALAIIVVGLAAVYGGYFGAGLGVITLALLGLALHDNLTRLNAVKQFMSFFTNIAAAIFFVFSGKVVWSAALVMMAGALVGGSLGGRMAGKVSPVILRRVVVSLGVIVGIVYLVR